MLLLAGHDLEVLDRWSWAQVQLAQEAIMLAVAGGLELVLGPVAQALGGEYKTGQVRAPTPPARPTKHRPTTVAQDDPAARARAEKRDAALMMGAGRAGIALDL